MSAMYLKLSLPPRTDHPSTETETRPADLERWIARLPLLNTAEATQLLSRQLIGLNRMTLEDKQRLKLLELLRAPVQAVCQELHKTYMGLPQPLPDKARQIANQVRLLLTEMAYGYKLIAFNSTAVPKLELADRALLTVALHRGIRYLTEILYRGYELYSPPPEGTWFEIHQLYRYAEMLGITESPVDDKLNNTLPQVSISHAYKHALLLDFSDPYHLPARMLTKINRYLDRYASLAQLSPGIAALKSHCQFLLNLDNDRAGAVNTEASPITTEVRYRLLNTTDLARIIHQQLMVVQAGQMPDPDGLEKDYFVQFGQDLLVRMIQAWGVNPKRVFTRSARENDQRDVAFGVDAINYYLHGSEPFTPSTSEVGPQPNRTAIGDTAGTPNKIQQSPSAPLKASWELIDESAGGYALARSGTAPNPVRVGDLLASRPQANGSGWEIGVVRWVRTSGTDSIEIGVQRLSPSASAVAVLPLEDSRDRYFLALNLPEVKPMKQPETLVTVRGFYKPNRVFYLDNAYRTRQIKALKLIELSGSFERFQYEFLDP
ncbi:MAG TPA: hypothetical protein DIC36_07610 [Gammaproteobacteria bacterium]|nr:hypothetical protein [Gammaproteobacteria bacterium]